MARLSCSQAGIAGSGTLKPHPSNCPLEGSTARSKSLGLSFLPSQHTTVGQAKARLQSPGGRQTTWTLRPPTPTTPKRQGCPQESLHILCRGKGPTSLPKVSRSDIKAQNPGPSGLLELQWPGQP